MRRRELLTGGAGVATALSGCLGLLGECNPGETWEGTSLRIERPVAVRGEDGWTLTATLTLGFHFARSDRLGFDEVGIRAYGRSRQPIGSTFVDGATWGALPDANRSTDECGYDHGSTTRSVSLATREFPRWIEALGAGGAYRRGHDDGTDRLRYVGETPPPDRTGAYGEASPEGGSFPPIDDNDATPAPGIHDLAFDLDSCYGEPDRYVSARTFTDGEFEGIRTGWFRELDDPCQRPLLEAVALEGETFEAVVGVHTVERARCVSGCRTRNYTITATFDDRPRRVRLIHVDAAGERTDERTLDLSEF